MRVLSTHHHDCHCEVQPKQSRLRLPRRGLLATTDALRPGPMRRHPRLFSDYSELQEVLLRQEGVLFGEGVARVDHFFDDGVARDEVIF